MSHENDLTCPECHTKMEHGYIPTGGGMHWYRKAEHGALDFAEPVAGTHTVLRRARLIAWRCKKCHLITFRFGQSVDPDASHVMDQPEEEASEPS